MPRKPGNPFLADAATLGLTLAAALVLFTYLGYLLDQWLDSSPAFLLTGSLLGLAGGMAHVVRKANESMGPRGGGPARKRPPPPPPPAGPTRAERDDEGP